MTKAKTARVEPTEFPVKVRFVIWPEDDQEVDETEWRDLYRQGLLVDGYDGTTEVRQSEVNQDPELVPVPPPGTPSGKPLTKE